MTAILRKNEFSKYLLRSLLLTKEMLENYTSTVHSCNLRGWFACYWQAFLFHLALILQKSAVGTENGMAFLEVALENHSYCCDNIEEEAHKQHPADFVVGQVFNNKVKVVAEV